MDMLEERYGLVVERLEQIYQETAVFFDESGRYWHLCAGLALDKGTEDMHFLDYSVCSLVFGERGRYLCLLYAQMMQVSRFRRSGQKELVCICCELLAQLYRISMDDGETREIRNTLYWFYSDYCELYTGFWINELCADAGTVIAGGPMLLMDAKTSEAVVWRQHAEDFGLYMGSRFEERCYQAVMLRAGGEQRNACRCFAELLGAHAEYTGAVCMPGFQAAERQRDGLLHLAQRILDSLAGFRP